MSPDEIVAQFPSLTLSDVHIALAYYFDHIEEIQLEMRHENAVAEEYRPDHPSLVESRLKQNRLDEAS
jgi:hypothetical protein